MPTPSGWLAPPISSARLRPSSPTRPPPSPVSALTPNVRPMRTVIETADAVRRGELKAVEVLDECLAAIDRDNERLNAFVHVDPDLARRAAEAVDEAVAAG